jgi:small-conductance mechanosensitive channel
MGVDDSNVSSWVDSVRSGVSDALHQVFSYLPHILGALVVLLIGVIVAYILKAIVVRVLRAIKLKPYLDKVGWNQVFPGRYDFVELIGDLVKWFFILVFLLQALAIANLLQVKDLVESLLAYLPNVVVAVVLIFVGGILADLLARIITGTVTVVSAKGAVVLGNIARYTVWIVVAFTALAQLKVNTIFLDRLFTAVVAMLAIAGGLAFGLGGQNVAKDTLESLRRNLRREE